MVGGSRAATDGAGPNPNLQSHGVNALDTARRLSETRHVLFISRGVLYLDMRGLSVLTYVAYAPFGYLISDLL